MDQVPAGDTSKDLSSDTIRALRGRMRAQARGRRPAGPPDPDVFLTPQWLERSFVLPLTEPEATEVPTQPVPHHDDYERPAEPVTTPAPEFADEPAPTFVRPPTKEIDFARVIKRSDASRTAFRTALAAGAVAGLVMILFLLLGSAIVLGMAISFGLIAVVALGVRIRLATAPVPHLDH